MKINDVVGSAYQQIYSINRTAQKPIVQPEQIKITEEEKQFFSGIYPDKKEAIMDYHFYQKDGRMSGVSLGTLIDRRG